MRIPSHSRLAVAIGLGVLAMPVPVGAQQAAAPTTRSYVQVVRLKPEMVRTWLDLQEKEVVPALKKAGVPSRVTLVTVVGNSFEYTMITPFPTFAAMDGEAPLVRALGETGAAQLNDKLRLCIMSQNTYLTNRRDDLSIAAPLGEAPIWRVVVRRALPGKMQEYLSFYRAEILPAMQRAKAEGKIVASTVATRGAGAPAREFTTVTMYAKFADLDAGNPISLTLGAEAAARIGEKADQLTTTGQTYIRRRVANLSY
ncbi:MAG: hypothetical protein SFV24_06135 [Gemmatimonadales bacterium]|nr:hypothetical protein [Gemmatimonadales bacterium]